MKTLFGKRSADHRRPKAFRYSLFTLSKITAGAHAGNSASPDPRPNDASRRSCRSCPAASAVARATARAAPLRKRRHHRHHHRHRAPAGHPSTSSGAPLSRATRNDALRRSVGGGGERIRTVDLLLAKQALSQLSYTPKASGEARSPWRRQRLREQPPEPHRAGRHPSLAGASL